MNNVLNFINNLKINKDENIIVACSGGADSMFLIDLLYREGYKVICAHVNHKIRSASDAEYLFVSDYASKRNIIFEGIELTDKVNGNFENYAREFRYNFFESLIKKYNANYLFTAHHGDDLMETIMMRLVRGSSLKGYSGFSKITYKKDYKIVRPLIYLTKDYIEKYNQKNNIEYVIDESNFTDDYTRNRFRHHLLPFLKEEDLLVNEKFLYFSEELKRYNDYIELLVNKNKKILFNDNILDLKEFNKLDEFIKEELIRNILAELYPDNLYLVNYNHIKEIIKIINSRKANISFKLPNNINVKKTYDKLMFMTDDNVIIDDFEYEVSDEVNIYLGTIKKVSKSDSTSNYVIRLNSKNIKLPIIVRNRRIGDKMQVKNMQGTKKINDIFIDNKIDVDKRNIWPVVTDANNTILWVPGVKKSQFDVPKSDEYDIILTYVEKEMQK